MRHVVVTVLVAAVVVGIFLTLAWGGLSYWKEQDTMRAAAAMMANSEFADAVVVDNPYEHEFSSEFEYYARLLAGFSIVGGLWVTCIVLPMTVGMRHLLRNSNNSRVFSYVSVISLSAFVFPFLSSVGPWPQLLVYAIGGAIGLVAVGVVDRMLPPNKSLERTREG